MNRKRKKHSNQLKLPLDYRPKPNENFLNKIKRIKKSKNLMNESFNWHFHRLRRIYEIIKRLEKRTSTRVIEMRRSTLKERALFMMKRAELELKWSDQLKKELYDLI